ncbi:response regulator [Brevundimonas sp. Root1279]|uniref:response regulator n=1 Tax=Brevundimonas sp. Root1279 TaxID=1736443 RepID=UPI0006F87DAC|nr:response regulator transcription factor [Brevundimonas sp. Root1279]KQW80827.1 two-component system response regulator [Brevundimonas sp. Root1279]
MRLLLVEDNVRLSDLVSERLNARGFCCDCAYTLQSAVECLDTSTYDLVVLDLGLPDGDGQQWLQAQRRRGFLPPTLILTARNGLEDRIEGLNAGADDYLAKPFEVEELIARLRALMRRPGLRSQPVLEVGALRFESASRAGAFDGAPLDLSRREADLLELLMRNAGSLVPRRVIDDALYGIEEAVTPNAVEAIVSRLRRKIETAGGEAMLHTVRGIGYLLRAPAAR